MIIFKMFALMNSKKLPVQYSVFISHPSTQKSCKISNTFNNYIIPRYNILFSYLNWTRMRAFSYDLLKTSPFSYFILSNIIAFDKYATSFCHRFILGFSNIVSFWKNKTLWVFLKHFSRQLMQHRCTVKCLSIKMW